MCTKTFQVLEMKKTVHFFKILEIFVKVGDGDLQQ